MLSSALKRRKEIRDICANSGDVTLGKEYSVPVFANDGITSKPFGEKKVICIGKLSDNERIFRTEDGKGYFSIIDGWGAKDGILYGLSVGFSLPLDEPITNPEELRALLDERTCPVSFASAMKNQSRRNTIRKILESIKVTDTKKTE